LLVNPASSEYQDTLKQVMDYFMAQGSSLAHAQQQAFTWIGQQVQAQAAYLAYIDVFWTLMLISAGAALLALVLRKVKLGGPAPAQLKPHDLVAERRLPFECVALVLQGGGALGAYQAGVRALGELHVRHSFCKCNICICKSSACK
jgi:hypothetical protein